MKSDLQRRFEKLRDEPEDLEYAEAELHYTDFASLDDFRAFCERHGLKYTAECAEGAHRHFWVAPDGCVLQTHRDPADPREQDDPGYLSYTAVRGPAGAVEALLRDLVESCSYLKGAFSALTTDSGDVLLSPYEYREEYRQQQRDDDGDLIRPETDGEVAEKLGVSRRLVSDVISNGNDSIIYHDRVKAREYYKENPDASYREVSRNVDASQPTVTEWLKEDFDEGGDERDGVDVSALLGWLNPHQRRASYAHVPVSIPGSDAETLRASEYDSIPELPAGAAYGSGVSS